MPTAIKIENLSKQYRLGVVSTGTLSHDLKRWWTTSILRKEDPYLKIGETNVLSPNSSLAMHNSKLNSQYVWALKDINLDIEQGDVVGIIGKNGAGKSTLLKILSRVTKPTTGSIQYNGRIASLLEVGTGFHPEMTGRENIYMNGAIMGMTKAEITRKLDEIIDFAGVERYIDTPVKRYSSGMTVRLGFSIAAHLEPDILVVDEVLAVGDAEFQRKAIGKMQDVSKGGGRTVLFVSHNMASVKQLCNKGVLLKDGAINYVGSIDDTIEKYLERIANKDEIKLNERTDRVGNGFAKFTKVQLFTEGKETNRIQTGKAASFILNIMALDDIKDVDIVISIYNRQGVLVTSTKTKITTIERINLKKGKNAFICAFDTLPLNSGNYYINISVNQEQEHYDWIENAFTFSVIEDNMYNTGKNNSNSKSIITLQNKWSILK